MPSSLATIDPSVVLDYIELQIDPDRATLPRLLNPEDSNVQAVEAALLTLAEERRLGYVRMTVFVYGPGRKLPVNLAWIHPFSTAIIKRTFPILHSRGLLLC